MAFDWMEAPHAPNAAAFTAQFEREIREFAGRLARLGYPQAEATERAWARLSWEFETSKKPPLTKAAVKKLVAAAY